jgi:hypothetical protein
MKRSWLIPFLSVLLSVNAVAQQYGSQLDSSPKQTVSVHGIVFDSLTRKPLDKVHIMLTQYSSNGEPAIIYGAMSDATGHFSVPDIPTGSYSVFAEKRGFIFILDDKKENVRLDRVKLELKPGTPPPELVLRMVVHSILAGRVLDEHGDPMMNASVTAISLNGGPVTSVYTNGRGEFRLSVPPGKYYIVASKWSDSDTTEDPRGARSESGYVHTYYPGVIGTRSASAIEAFAGNVVNGLDLSMIRPQTFRVSGEITAIPQGHGPLALFWIRADRGKKWQQGSDEGRIDFTSEEIHTGSASSIAFYSPPLNPGMYDFYAVCSTNGKEFQTQMAEITLADSDVTDLHLELVSGFEIVGSIVTKGAVFPSGEKISVSLHPLQTGTREVREGEIDKTGHFKISDVFPDRYYLEVGPLVEDAFVSSIEVNKVAVSTRVLDLSDVREAAKAKIVVSANGGRITGKVRGEKNDVPGPSTEVLLFPERDGISADKEECHSTAVDPAGTYSFRGLAPGHYRLLVNSSLGLDECQEIAAAIQNGIRASDKVEVKSGETTMRDLTVADRSSSASHN